MSDERPEIIIRVLRCPRCGKPRAWVSIYDGDVPPTDCFECNGRLQRLHGQEAADICFAESEDWRRMANHALEQAKLNLRFEQALRREAFAEQRGEQR